MLISQLEVCQEGGVKKGGTWRTLRIPDWHNGWQSDSWCHDWCSFTLRNISWKFQVHIFICCEVIRDLGVNGQLPRRERERDKRDGAEVNSYLARWRAVWWGKGSAIVYGYRILQYSTTLKTSGGSFTRRILNVEESLCKLSSWSLCILYIKLKKMTLDHICAPANCTSLPSIQPAG